MKDKILNKTLAVGLVIFGVAVTFGAIALTGFVVKLAVNTFMFGFNLI